MATKTAKPQQGWRCDRNGLAHLEARSGCITKFYCHTPYHAAGQQVVSPENGCGEIDYCHNCELRSILARLPRKLSEDVSRIFAKEVKINVEQNTKYISENSAHREKDLAAREARVNEDRDKLYKKEEELRKKEQESAGDKDTLELGKAMKVVFKHLGEGQAEALFGGRRHYMGGRFGW